MEKGLGIALAKIKPPESESDLRIIAKTPFCSKLYESFVYDWLIEIIQPFLDPEQYGVKGSSITHYLLKFLHFIQSSLDISKPNLVMAAFIDMSKAFNRVDHNLLIEDLYNMKCPSWLLRIMYSFLSNRVLIFNYKGSQSSPKNLPGGAPQGTLLGVICFIVKFNGALLRPPVIRPVTSQSDYCKAKYMDDISVAINLLLDKLSKCKKLSPEDNLLQSHLNELLKFCNENGMKINQNKSKLMMFSRSREIEVPIQVSMDDKNNLEVIDSFKLLGVMVSNDLKWEINTDYICSKARKKIFLIRNMKLSGLSTTELIDAYKKEIRSLVEMAVPVWHSGLTLEQCRKIERVQKSALSAILGNKYNNYDDALKLVKLDRLSSRRTKLCLKFIQKNMKSDNPLLSLVKKSHNTRSDPKLANEFQCRTKSYFSSGLPYLARL